MKQDKYIKYLLASFSSILIYVLGYLVINYIFNLRFGGEFILGMAIQVIIYKELIINIPKGNHKKILLFIVPLILGLILYGLDNLVIYLFAFFIHISIIAKLDRNSIEKRNYFEILKKQFGILLVTTLFLSGAIDEISSYLGRFYIVLFILAIIMLKSVRNYQHRLVVKNEKIKAIGIAILLIILCNDILFAVLFNTISKAISTILSRLVNSMTFILYPLISTLWNSLEGYQNNYQEVQGNVSIDSSEEFLKIVNESNPMIMNILEILISIVILYIIYLTIKKIRNINKTSENNISNEEIIIREKVGIDSNRSILKRKKYIGNDNKTTIKKIFYDIQFLMMKYNLYKDEYSATELINMLNEKNSDDIRIDKIYNKAKFSNNYISDGEVLIAKEDSKKIKNKIKKFKKHLLK